MDSNEACQISANICEGFDDSSIELRAGSPRDIERCEPSGTAAENCNRLSASAQFAHLSPSATNMGPAPGSSAKTRDVALGAVARGARDVPANGLRKDTNAQATRNGTFDSIAAVSITIDITSGRFARIQAREQ
jgi:hypothetical protein